MAFRQRVTVPSTDSQTARFLVVQLRTTRCALWAETVRGVLTPGEVSDRESVTLLGELYRQTPLAARLHLPDGPLSEDSRFILCGRGQARCMVVVDRINGLTEVSRQAILPLPSLFRGEERRWFRGMLLLPDGPVAILNPDWVLFETETVGQSLATTA